MDGHVLVITTWDDVEAATRLGESLVEARLAACAQVVGPVRSVYRWEGAVTSSTEWQLHVKTTGERVAEVTEHIVAQHGYDVPEVIAVPITGGHRAYLDWVTAETG
ncbi:divalent-cation tolerance protein CutA [Actinokineospora spheciospongiae]|uniref:divalent-cation tolerance protein CutA n=1 Tax=Actinokineospora spheciospongiae TaxID=909613 RepID=UPI000D719FFC|nr:divalent-cation tolerance protein CutA [Actinokineospora spheciospongiae]